MGKYRQTFARIGFGLVAIAAVATWLWPEDKAVFLSDPFKIFGFLTAVAVWIAAEFYTSEEFVERASTPNDIRHGKEFLNLYRGALRDLLKDHNTWSYLDDKAYTDIGALLNKFERSEIKFSDADVSRLTGYFFKDLRAFYRFMSSNTTPEMIAGRSMTGFKPYNIVSDEDYQRLQNLAKEADKLADIAWGRLEALARAIEKAIPEALD